MPLAAPAAALNLSGNAMKLKNLAIVVTLAGLQTLTTSYAQTKDTLQKIRESGTIQLGGRDA